MCCVIGFKYVASSKKAREISLEAEKKKQKTAIERQGNNLRNRLPSFLVCWRSLSGPRSSVITECVLLSEPAAF